MTNLSSKRLIKKEPQAQIPMLTAAVLMEARACMVELQSTMEAKLGLARTHPLTIHNPCGEETTTTVSLLSNNLHTLLISVPILVETANEGGQ